MNARAHASQDHAVSCVAMGGFDWRAIVSLDGYAAYRRASSTPLREPAALGLPMARRLSSTGRGRARRRTADADARTLRAGLARDLCQRTADAARPPVWLPTPRLARTLELVVGTGAGADDAGAAGYPSRSKMLACCSTFGTGLAFSKSLTAVSLRGEHDVVERGVRRLRLHAPTRDVDEAEASELLVVVLADVLRGSAFLPGVRR
jgi:hypothetical protein